MKINKKKSSISWLTTKFTTSISGITLCCLLFFFSPKAQGSPIKINKHIDSSRNIELEPCLRIKNIRTLVQNFSQVNKDTLNKLFSEAKPLLHKCNDITLRNEIQTSIKWCSINIESKITSKDSIIIQVREFLSFPENTFYPYTYHAHRLLAKTFMHQKEFDSSIYHFEKTKVLAKENNDVNTLLSTNAYGMMIYTSFGLYNDALAIFHSNFNNKISPKQKLELLNSLCLVYHEQKKYDSMVWIENNYFNKGIPEGVFKYKPGLCINIIGANMSINNNKHAQELIARWMKINGKNSLFNHLTKLLHYANAKIEFENGNFKTALNKLILVDELATNKLQLIPRYLLKSKVYARLGNIKMMEQSLNQYVSSKSTIDSIASTKKHHEAIAKYELKQHEANIAKLQKEVKLKQSNNRLFAFLILLSVFIGLILIIYLQERNKRKVNEAKLALYNSKMQPHFIFNALSALQAKIIDKNTTEALDILHIITKITRRSIQHSADMFASIDEELTFIKEYVQLEKMRFGSNIAVEYTIDKNIDTSAATIPHMLLQPLIENSLKHGIRKRILEGEQGLIDIKIGQKNQQLIIAVSDNGVGFSEEVPGFIKEKHALSIIRKRINLLFPENESGVSFANNHPTGAKVLLTLPQTI